MEKPYFCLWQVFIMKQADLNYLRIHQKYQRIYFILISLAFDHSEIPNISHSEEKALQLWLATTLGKDPAFIDPWGNEYVYEFPLENGGAGYRLFSMGPDGKTGDEFSKDDIGKTE